MIKKIIKDILKLIHDPTLSDEAKYHLILAHNELMKVYENDRDHSL